MSDSWGRMPGDPGDAANTGGHTGGNIDIPVPPGLDAATAAITALTESMMQLQNTMAGFGQQQAKTMSSTFSQVASGANTATESIKTLFQSMGGNRPAGSSLATILDYGAQTGLVEDIARFPMRFMQSTMGQNRQTALNVAGALSGQQYATGVRSSGTSDRNSIGNMYSILGNTFGAGVAGIPQGTADEITGWLQIARQAGAQVDLNRLGGGTMSADPTNQNPRSKGFMEASSQIQQMYPSMPLPQIGATLGGFVANSGAQRQGAMLTGGAFSMVKSGGGIKTVDEWAERILRWLEDSRPGGKRGQGFTYDELISQQYPGSNMDAWFEMNGVPQDMREVFWNYALAKARTTSTTTGSPMPMSGGTSGLGGQNLAAARLKSTQPMTQTSLNLAGSLSGLYETREGANKTFNSTVGQLSQKTLTTALASGGPLNFLKYMPDTIEELLTSILERSGMVGAGIQGAIGYGGAMAGGAASIIENLFGNDGLLGNFGNVDDLTAWLAGELSSLAHVNVGDVGDVGDWGPTGATSPNSLHPSMNAKVSAMMKANPRLKMNSGRRDEALQRKLKSQGYANVSGKSSAHTRGLAADIGPRSEYGWLKKNASKFGLQSGANHGEPWHVGLPGIGDIDLGEDRTAVADKPATGAKPATVFGLGSLLNLFGGGGGDDLGASLQGGLGGLFNLMFGQMASSSVMGKQTDADIEKSLAFDPEAANKMFAAASYKTGGIYGKDTSIFDKILEAAKVKASIYTKTTANAIPGGNQGGSGSESLSGALQALGISATGLSDGAMVALLANKAGWSGDELVKAVAIAGRESSFQPTAHRSDVDKALMSGDRGLWQINAGAWNDWLMEQGFIKDKLDRAIFDPWINAQAAYGIYARAGNFGPWTMGPNGWDANGDPFYGTDRNAAQGYVKEAGLGDVDMSMPEYTPTQPMVVAGPSGPIHFNSTFNISAPSGGGGNSGIDTRRLVTMLADQLESEMRRRMVRSN